MNQHDDTVSDRTTANQSMEAIYKVLSDVELDNPAAPDPWEQLENEPDVAYAAFKVYLFSDPRTYRRVVQYIYEENQRITHPKRNSDEEFLFQPAHDSGIDPITGQSIVRQIEESVYSWSTVYVWKERATKYDLFRDYADDIRKLQKRRKNVWLHLDISDAMLEIALTRLGTLDASLLGPKVLAEFVKTAVEIQRVSLGLSTQNIFGINQVNVGGKVTIEKKEEDSKLIEAIKKDPELKSKAIELAERMMDLEAALE